MSICSDLGYKEGDLFKVKIQDHDGGWFGKGAIIRLEYDDSTKKPKFSLISGEYLGPDDSKPQLGYCELVSVEPLSPKISKYRVLNEDIRYAIVSLNKDRQHGELADLLLSFSKEDAHRRADSIANTKVVRVKLVEILEEEENDSL